MTEQHPITPPPELFKQWEGMPRSLAFEAAYRAGADKELEACIDFVRRGPWCSEKLRAARRPKPPSLKEQALVVLDDLRSINATHYNILRNALEQLND